MPKTKQSDLIASTKNAKHRFHQQIYYKLRNKERGYSLLVTYQSLLINIFPLAPHQIIFLYKM